MFKGFGLLKLLFQRARSGPALGCGVMRGSAKDFRAFSGENLRGRVAGCR